MKVAILNDLPVSGVLTGGFGSGTEISIGNFVREGHKRGHIVDVIHPEYCSKECLSEYELLITKNIHAFTPAQVELIARYPFVAWPSDYQWNKQRLYFAFQERDQTQPDTKAWGRFFRRSRLIVYLSPLHQETYEWVMPELKEHPNTCSPPMVDVDLMKPHPDGWIPDTACTINGGLDFKGLHNQLDWAYAHPEVKFTFIGAMRESVQLPPNAEFVGRVNWPRLAEILGRTQYYVELPKTPQPYNQSVICGLLACQSVITNDLMGAASYPWFRTGTRTQARNAIKNAMPELWKTIEHI